MQAKQATQDMKASFSCQIHSIHNIVGKTENTTSSEILKCAFNGHLLSQLMLSSQWQWQHDKYTVEHPDYFIQHTFIQYRMCFGNVAEKVLFQKKHLFREYLILNAAVCQYAMFVVHKTFAVHLKAFRVNYSFIL